MKAMIALCLLALTVSAQALTLDASKGKTEFLAIGRPAALKINGKGVGPSGELTLGKSENDLVLNGTAEVDLSSFDTGISMRDRHMKETYLEVEKFKTAILTFTDVKIPQQIIKNGGTLNVKSLLNFHGVQAPVNVELSMKPQKNELVTQAKFKVDLATFNVQVPKYAGITVANDVTVTTETLIANAELML